ncbi:MAG: oligopeptide/dipeptide ABC transporter ATP-binding protein [Acidimicrobiales bacterium]
MAGTGIAHLRAADASLMRVDDLTVEFRRRGSTVHAVSGISIDVLEGETLGLVGESGCGKSTTGRAIVQLPRPSSGSVTFRGRQLTTLSNREMRKLRPSLQMIYQDPISSLNPCHTVGEIVGEPLKVWGSDKDSRQAKVDDVLRAVGLDPQTARGKYPKEFSGGQCQRICIARALILDPKLLICDEPVSALDVSVQAQILNLLEDMKARYGLTMVFIAHDLAVVKNISDRVVVMYLGKLCEVGPPDELYAAPAHPYTEALLSAIPEVDVDSPKARPKLLTGEVASSTDPPSGCRFRTRCPRAEPRCAEEEPMMRPLEADENRFVACHFPLVAAKQVSSAS